MPFGRGRSKPKAGPSLRLPGKARVTQKPKYYLTPSDGSSPETPPAGTIPRARGLLKHKEWRSGDPLSTKVERARQQIDQGTYRPPKQNGELRNRKIGYGGKVGSVPGERIGAAHFEGTLNSTKAHSQERNEKRAEKKNIIEEARKKKDTKHTKKVMEIDPTAPSTRKDFRLLRERQRKRDDLKAKGIFESKRMREYEAEGIEELQQEWRDRLEESKDRGAWERNNPGMDWWQFRKPPTEKQTMQWAQLTRHERLGRNPIQVVKEKEGEEPDILYTRLWGRAERPR